MSSSKKVVFEIDAKNKIVSIDEGWDEAASEAGASKELEKEKILGRYIEEFEASDTTQMYYNAIFKLCRIKQEKLQREYRCDSSTHKRFMRVTLVPLPKNHIQLIHETLREEAFTHTVVINDKTYTTDKKQKYIKRCSVCNSIQNIGETLWIPPESLCEDKSIELNVIHTVCQSCKIYPWKKIK